MADIGTRFACLLALFKLARIACLLHFSSKQAVSITLFGPRPNKRAVTGTYGPEEKHSCRVPRGQLLSKGKILKII